MKNRSKKKALKGGKGGERGEGKPILLKRKLWPKRGTNPVVIFDALTLTPLRKPIHRCRILRQKTKKSGKEEQTHCA